MSARSHRLPPAVLTPAVEAHRAVAAAVKDGRLPPLGACWVTGCGEVAREYHHWSYLPEHRLAVVGLCVACHGKVHASEIPEPLTGLYRARRTQAKRVVRYDDLDELGKLIRDARGPATQAEFAARLGVRQSVLSAVEIGSTNASLSLIGRLIRFGLDELALFRAAVERTMRHEDALLSSSAHPARPATSAAGEPTTTLVVSA